MPRAAFLSIALLALIPAAVVGLIALTGCASASADQLRARAAHDLQCPADDVLLISIDRRTAGAEGCGSRATYVESCDGNRAEFGTQCTWVLNADVVSTDEGSEEPVEARDPEPPSDGCSPPCSPGFACNAGQCVAQCNPPCPEGMWCGADRSCQPIRGQDSVAPSTGPATDAEGDERSDVTVTPPAEPGSA